MSVDEVAEKLGELLKDYQDESEQGKKPIGDDTRPLDDMKGFESDFIPEIVHKLAREVFGGLPKGTRVKNIFVDNGKKLTVKEIAKKFIVNYAPAKRVKV
jgi:hypothetical protein